jgi:hypothetical protein
MNEIYRKFSVSSYHQDRYRCDLIGRTSNWICNICHLIWYRMKGITFIISYATINIAFSNEKKELLISFWLKSYLSDVFKVHWRLIEFWCLLFFDISAMLKRISIGSRMMKTETVYTMTYEDAMTIGRKNNNALCYCSWCHCIRKICTIFNMLILRRSSYGDNIRASLYRITLRNIYLFPVSWNI